MKSTFSKSISYAILKKKMGKENMLLKQKLNLKL